MNEQITSHFLKKNRQPVSHMSLQFNQHGGHKKQQGVVLIWAVIFLIVVTILGLGAIKMSGIDTQIAGNSTQTMLAYQNAESGLAKSAKYKNIDQAAKNGGAPYAVPAADLQPSQRASVQFEASNQGCPRNIANSSKFRCAIFRIKAEANAPGTISKATHSLGWAEIEAPVNKN